MAVQAQDGREGQADGWDGLEVTGVEGYSGGPDVRCFSVGPIQENAYIVRANAEANKAVMIDPGEEPQRLLDAAQALGVEIEAILVTHCHFDHIGAVAPIAKATGAPVYCPEIEGGVLADIMKWTMAGFGPFESWVAEETVKGGERLKLAGMDIEVVFTPGHSPGHVTYAISSSSPVEASGVDGPEDSPVLLSGDVLFQGSVGRTDLPGGDWGTLERSIGSLMGRFERDTSVYPGHIGATTLGREWDANPFLAELRAAAKVPVERAREAPQPQGVERARRS
ncbi:MAG: MBL fold metallo-hydrolase [Solirubrobacteraceae bacterium]